MKKIVVSLVMVLCLGMMSSVSYAAVKESKIGVLNMHEIFLRSPQVKAIRAELKKEFAPREAKIKAAQAAIQKQTQKLYRESSVMTPVKKQQIENQIASDRRNLQTMEANFQQDANTAQHAAMEKFLAKINADVKVLAKEGNFDLIMLSDGVPFVSQRIDITPKVLKMLGANKG